MTLFQNAIETPKNFVQTIYGTLFDETDFKANIKSNDTFHTETDCLQALFLGWKKKNKWFSMRNLNKLIKVNLFHLKFQYSTYATPDDGIVIKQNFNFCSLLKQKFSQKECRRWRIHILWQIALNYMNWNCIFLWSM